EALDGLFGCSGFHVDGPADGYRDYLAEVAVLPDTPIADESCGAPMLYSSGTTGRPKGVKFPLPEGPIDQLDRLTAITVERFGYAEDMVYLSPTPLYRAAPLRWSMCAQRCGGTIVVMEKLDAEAALALVESKRITHSQWVPTHFVRMLKLEAGVR